MKKLPVDIKQFQEHVKDLSQHFDTQTPERRIMFLMTEVGEVVDEVIQLSNVDANTSDNARDEIKARIGMEIYDVIWNAVDLANLLEIDLETAFKQKIEFNEKRRWKHSDYNPDMH